MHANSMLFNKNLTLNVIYPYKAVQELNELESNDSENTNWCTKVDVTLLADTLVTKATDSQDDYLLQELVEDLQLSGELFAV
jgi:hypothetical protein